MTIDNYWRWLNTWFEWACKRGYIRSNPMQSVPRPAPVKVEADVIPPQDFVRVINVLNEIIAHTSPRQHGLPYEQAARDLAIIRFAYATSCRVSEIAGLRMRDLHLEEGRAIIQPNTTKSKKKREVYFGRQARRALEMWLETRPNDVGDRVFIGTRGNGWSRQITRFGIYQAWRKRQQAAGVGPYKFHEIRHSHVTHSMDSGIPLHHVSRQAGHSSTEITARVYVHSQDPDRQRAYSERNPDDMLEGE